MRLILSLCLSVLATAVIAAPSAHPGARVPTTAADHAVDASAVNGPFAIGAEVRDASGALLGRISRMTSDKDGRSQLLVRKGVDSFAIPATDVRLQNGVAVSTRTREELKRGP